MQICDFKPKHMPGLYSFHHFEHPSGAFIQRSVSLPLYWVHCDSDGNMTEHNTIDSLSAAVHNDT